MAITMTPLQPGTEAAAQAAAFDIFGSDIPPIGPENYNGSWRTALHVIAEEWVGEGRVEQHAARTAAALKSSSPRSSGTASVRPRRSPRAPRSSH
ncbi:hypothetical protein [Streptomyces sp. SID1328]|uniref:hypothetical protein n=1 Tax=Streptomyces sp. SID1328 TaxID=2690250 RepID=UPI001F3B4FB2|nr:hypothetical protein [Streptomyces sp. SID1328]